ncbi:MAG: phytoene/squalene synthase family protein [bacterium]
MAQTLGRAPVGFDDAAIAQCSRTIREHSKSFALASRLLPARARDEAVVLYAWCRYADDAVDEAPPGEQAAALARLEAELDAIYRGEAMRDPVLAAFAALVRRRAIPELYPRELVAGMRMDVEGARYPRSETLSRYCYRVASTVGLMMCHVMGLRDDGASPKAALHLAAHLGIAMQLTNICRDVAEDWGRGRRYLPADRLPAAAHVEPAGVGAALPASLVAPFSMAIARLLAEADRHYAAGDRGLDALPWRSALAVAAARHIYRDIGRVVAAQGHDPSAGRAWTSKGRKLWLVGRALAQVAASAPRRLWWAVSGRGRFIPPPRALPFEALAAPDAVEVPAIEAAR